MKFPPLSRQGQVPAWVHCATHPLLEGGGKVIFGELLDGPLPAASEDLLPQCLASQVIFHLWEEEKVGWSQIQRIWRVGDGFDLLGGDEILHNGG